MCCAFFILGVRVKRTAGHYRRFPANPAAAAADEHQRLSYEPQCDKYSDKYNATADCSHNSWELFQMPIKASYVM